MRASSCNLIVFLCLVTVSFGHSGMSVPQGITSSTCRLGGDPKFGVDDCPGPCDLDRFKKTSGKPWSRHYPTILGHESTTVSATYQRGQKVTIKYTRNNHGPGGFIRMTLVPLKDMMKKKIHDRNAFHYGCWGANPVRAKSNELGNDKFGFGLIGSDGKEHPHPKGYYTMDLTIPPVVPDGKYILGWAWFGGCSGKILGNKPQEPKPYPYFSDYWSCSYVEVKGGAKIVNEYTPVFVNDNTFSKDGCMAHADKLGQCKYEPCTIKNGKAKKCYYRKPAKFLKNDIEPLVPEFFGGTSDKTAEDSKDKNDAKNNDDAKDMKKDDPKGMMKKDEAKGMKKDDTKDMKNKDEVKDMKKDDTKDMKVKDDKKGMKVKEDSKKKGNKSGKGNKQRLRKRQFRKAFYSCLCYGYGRRCSRKRARRSAGCKRNTPSRKQPRYCRKACCRLCSVYKLRLCKHKKMRRVCRK